MGDSAASSRTLRRVPSHLSTALLTVATALVATLAAALVLGGCSGGSSPADPPPSTGTDASASTSSSSGFDGAALPAVPRARVHARRCDQRRPHRLTIPIPRQGRSPRLPLLHVRRAVRRNRPADPRRARRTRPPRAPVLIVSADPAADTPARVKRFLAQISLTGRVRWLTGSPAQLRAVWRAYGITPPSAGRGVFANSASVFLLDTAGRERVLFQSEQLTPEGLAHDIRKLERAKCLPRNRHRERHNPADTLARR